MAGERRCTVSQGDDLTGILGLSVITAPHQLYIGEKQLFAWCALDAVAIPAALHTDATVNSRLVDKGREVTLFFRDGKSTPQTVWI